MEGTLKISEKQKVFSKDYFYGRINSNYQNYDWYDNDQRWDFIIKRIKNLSCGGKILDIGCAFGFFLKRIAPFFNEVHGVDISEFAIERAKKQIPSAKLIVSDIEAESLPYPDGCFDVITAFDVLEHTQSIDKSIAKIIPKLKEKGYLIISLPVKDILGGRIFSFFDKDITHVSVPAKKQLFDIIKKNNLQIIERYFFFSGLSYRIPVLPFGIELYLQKE